MKQFLSIIAVLICTVIPAKAMSYEQARRQALFLTDKMAYELNLTEEQYEAAYEVNFDYLLGVNTQDDLYGAYWQQRNLDLSYILLDWQYDAFVAASYFYRPLYWDAGFWHFGIYARYPHRDYFFFGRPHFFDTYRGGHCWHNNGGHSWYHGRTFAPGRGTGDSHLGKNSHSGMRDGFQRGDFGTGQRHFGTQGNGRDNKVSPSGVRTDRGSQSVNRRQDGGTVSRPSGSSRGSSMGGSTFGSRRSSTRSTVSQGIRQGSQVAPSASRRGLMNNSTAGKRQSSVVRHSTTAPTRSASRGSSAGRSQSPSMGSRQGGHSSSGGKASSGSHNSGGSRSHGGSHGGRR